MAQTQPATSTIVSILRKDLKCKNHVAVDTDLEKVGTDLGQDLFKKLDTIAHRHGFNLVDVDPQSKDSFLFFKCIGKEINIEAWHTLPLSEFSISIPRSSDFSDRAIKPIEIEISFGFECSPESLDSHLGLAPALLADLSSCREKESELRIRRIGEDGVPGYAIKIKSTNISTALRTIESQLQTATAMQRPAESEHYRLSDSFF